MVVLPLFFEYVALMVVLPLFLICYGGSCVAYVVYKIYRNCSYQVTLDPGVMPYMSCEFP